MAEQALAQRYAESPLTTLVRRASSRRVAPTLRTQNSNGSANPPPSFTLRTAEAEETEYDTPLIPPGGEASPFKGHDPNYAPPSPLLHGHFGRDSIATTSSYDRDESYSYSSRRVDSYNSAAGSTVAFHQGYYNPDSYTQSPQDDRYHHPFDDGEDAYERSAYEESVYSQPDSALRDSWHSTATAKQLDNDRPGYTKASEITAAMRLDGSQRAQWDNQSLHSVVPSVFVSPEESDGPTQQQQQQQQQGRAKITAPVSGNFSRPLHGSSKPPPPSNLSEEQKRQVLLRNAGKRNRPQDVKTTGGPSPLRHQLSSPSFTTQQSGSGQSPSPMDVNSSSHLGPYQAHTQNRQGSSQSLAPPQHHIPSSNSRSRSLSPSPASRSTSPNMPPTASSSNANASASNLKHTLNNTSQARSHSPTTSVYSDYSYYAFEQAMDSPTGSTFSNSKDPFAASRPPMGQHKKSGLSQSNLLSAPNANPSPDPSNPQSAHDYLLLGIEHHEKDRLQLSASCFEKSAKVDGGCGVGMLMWGLTLRHGWGCEKNEKSAFKWLQKAAESAVGDLEKTRAGGKGGVRDAVEMGVVKSELILAIYEVGQCFFQGWGVKKDQKMAMSYYTIAAELGDADAQMDLAFCLANGKGCKKNKTEAAKWYRAAVKQGQSDVGLAWIYKEKYQ